MHLTHRLYLTHPDMEIVNRPAPQDGFNDVVMAAGSFNDIWSFKFRDGIETVKFGQTGWRLGYAEPAAASYFVFKALHEKGLIAPEVRFQVNLPAAGYGCYVFVPDPGDWPNVVPGYEAALCAEIANRVTDPAPGSGDPVRQDRHVQRRGRRQRARQPFGRHVRGPAPLGDRHCRGAVPEGVLLGYHLCYGGFEDWPTRTPPLTAVVVAANLAAEAAERPIDYIHLPLLAKQDADYFKALSGLKIGTAKLYLGVIHGMDDAGDFRFRIEQARKYASDFGIAAHCGTRALALSEAVEMYKTALGIY